MNCKKKEIYKSGCKELIEAIEKEMWQIADLFNMNHFTEIVFSNGHIEYQYKEIPMEVKAKGQLNNLGDIIYNHFEMSYSPIGCLDEYYITGMNKWIPEFVRESIKRFLSLYKLLGDNEFINNTIKIYLINCKLIIGIYDSNTSDMLAKLEYDPTYEKGD